MLELERTRSPFDVHIKVIGVGGGGGNAVNAMIEHDLEGVEFIVANTDVKDLQKSNAKIKLQIGTKLTVGKGTGARPDVGSQSAIESEEEIRTVLDGADMVFITAGMGGGTGSGAAPIIAKIARDMGILALAIVTKPFSFEGVRRDQNAEQGIKELSENVDTLVVIPNVKLQEIYRDLSFLEAFKKADGVLFQACRAISDIINKSGYINVDFADVQTVMTNMGYALMGTGVATGEDRAVTAAKEAISNPLLSDVTLDGCQAALINVTAGLDFKMSEFEEVMSVITNETGTNANIIDGVIIDPEVQDELSVTIIATGVSNEYSKNVTPIPEIHQKSKEDEKKELRSIFEKISHSNEEKVVEEKAQSQKHEHYMNNKYDIPSFMRKVSD